MIIPNIWKNNNVPNHQPLLIGFSVGFGFTIQVPSHSRIQGCLAHDDVWMPQLIDNHCILPRDQKDRTHSWNTERHWQRMLATNRISAFWMFLCDHFDVYHLCPSTPAPKLKYAIAIASFTNVIFRKIKTSSNIHPIHQRFSKVYLARTCIMWV